MKRNRRSIPGPNPKPKPAANTPLGAPAQAKLMEGLALHQKGQLAQAQAVYEQILKNQPRHFDALRLLGVIARQTKNYQQAVELLDKALEIDPTNAEAHSNRGNALDDLNQQQQAIDSYNKAIALKPDFAGAYSNRGNALKRLNRHQQALDSYNKAIALQPNFADFYLNRGNALKELKQYQQAIDSYDKVIALKPDYAEAYNNRGAAFRALKQHQQAIDSYDKAIALSPDYAEAHCNRGNALDDLKQHQAAIVSYDKALALKSDYEFLAGRRLHVKMHICDWHDFENQVSFLLAKIDQGEKATPSFSVLALTSSLSVQRKAAEIWVHDKHPINSSLGAIPRRPRGQKTRLGYFSMDFSNHPVSFLTAEIFELHDRDKFEVYAFSFGTDTKDEMRTRLEAAFDKFIDVRDKSEREIATLARQMEIDVAIDLAGFTGDSRPGIFALRAAPVQVNYIGFPATMGAPYIDYIIADKHVMPAEARTHYAEKVVYLPCFQANDNKRKISDKKYSRQELGLPETGFVFCCFNNNYKITPSTFSGWVRILKQVKGSVLFLYADNETAATNLRQEATQRGLDPNRLVFGQRIPMPEYLARYRSADLFLDTYPFNGGTTASDALWAGLPVLTRTGAAFASRMASSLLTAIDLPELITATQEDYETLAIELAINPERLKAIKQKLERNRLPMPLFDTKLFTRHLEDAYTQMVERYQAGLPPEHIDAV